MLARPVRTTVLAALLAPVLAVLGLCGLMSPAFAGDDDVTWAVRTGSNDFGADRTSFSYTVDPGAEVDDTLVVANHGTDPLALAVYASDGYTTASGQFDILTKDEPSANVGAWVDADATSVTVQPGATVDVPFTVRVPDDATPGDYAGGIVTALTQSDDAEGINVDRRLGVRINLHVGGEVAPSLAIENLHVAYHGSVNPFASGDATITYTIHNTGNTMLSAQQTASVTGPFGWFSAQARDAGAPPQLLPGESWKVTVPVDGVAPTFRLSASAALTPLLTDASGSTTPLDPEAATASGWAVPWALLVLVALVVAVVVGIRVLVRRRRGQRADREDARVQEAVEQALRERATPVS